MADVAPAPASDPTENDSTPEPAFLASGSEIGGLRYSITDVSRQASVMAFGDEHDASGEFLGVHLTVANVGLKGADISASDFHLKRDDKEYDEDSSLTLDGEFFLEKVSPGTSKSGLIIFDVPANTAPEKYSLEVYGNGSEGSQDSGLIKL